MKSPLQNAKDLRATLMAECSEIVPPFDQIAIAPDKELWADFLEQREKAMHNGIEGEAKIDTEAVRMLLWG